VKSVLRHNIFTSSLHVTSAALYKLFLRTYLLTLKVKYKPRYYRVPRYFSTVLTVAQNRWYRATLFYSFVFVLFTCQILCILVKAC